MKGCEAIDLNHPVNALAHFASDRGLLEMVRFDGTLVPDEVLESVEWNAPCPMLPSMYGLYQAYGQDWERDKADDLPITTAT